MNQSLIQTSLFDPLIPYIKEIRKDGYVEFDLPIGFVFFEVDQLRLYFSDGNYTAGIDEKGYYHGFNGYLIDENLINYLYYKHKQIYFGEGSDSMDAMRYMFSNMKNKTH